MLHIELEFYRFSYTYGDCAISCLHYESTLDLLNHHGERENLTRGPMLKTLGDTLSAFRALHTFQDDTEAIAMG